MGTEVRIVGGERELTQLGLVVADVVEARLQTAERNP
jgi:hypothetical protein